MSNPAAFTLPEDIEPQPEAAPAIAAFTAPDQDALPLPVAEENKTDWYSYAIIALLALMWGSSFILIKRGLLALSPMQLGSLRIFSAFVVLLPLSIPRLRQIPTRQLGLLFVSGLCGSMVPAWLFATAGAHLSSAISGSLNALSPLFTMLLGVFIFQTSISFRAGVGVLLGLAGAVALSLSKGGANLEMNAWGLVVVLATLMYAININILKKYMQGIPSLTISSVSLFCIGLVAAIHLFFMTDFLEKVANPAPGFWFGTGCTIFLGLMSTAFALVLFNKLIKNTSAIVASSVTYLMPAVAVGWGVLDGESILAIHYFGLALIFAGVFLVNRK